MQYSADRRLLGACLVVMGLFSFGALATSQEEVPTDKQNYAAYMAGKTLGYFLAHPSGALVKPFLKRISTTENSVQDFQNIHELLLPALVNANRITIGKLKTDLAKFEKDIDAKKKDEKKKAEVKKDELKSATRAHALVLAEALDKLAAEWLSVRSYDAQSLEKMANEAAEFLDKVEESELSSQWIAANRLAGFSNSLSNHATSHGIDLQAATKLAPQGLGILYGQRSALNHEGKMEPLWEMNRHLGANNELVKLAGWGNIAGTALKVPLHYGKDAFEAGNYTQAVSNVWEHADELGVYKLMLDGAHEGAETMRGLVWLAALAKHKEGWLAWDAGVKWVGELGPASRRLRKFAQLHPHGNLYLLTFQNTIAIPMFFLDFKEGYVGVLSEQWESLMQKENGSGEFYSESLNMALTGVGPVLAGLHLYLHGFGKKVAPGLENSAARHFYNGFQYGTYGLIQSAIHLNMFADFAVDTAGYKTGNETTLFNVGTIPVTDRSVAKAGTILVSALGAHGLYNGKFGERPRAIAQTWIPRAVKVLLFDNIASGVIGAATGDSHFNVLRSLFKASRDTLAHLWAGSPAEGEKQEL